MRGTRAAWSGFLALGAAILTIFIGIFVIRAQTAVSLMTAAAASSLLLVLGGVPYRDIEAEMVHAMGRMMLPVIRLLAVGALIGVWMASGTVPYLIYLGMRLLKPAVFLPVVCLLCAVMSATAGTSWGTVATVGVACMSIAAGLGIPAPMAAGAVVCGAIFGDKVSPLSDSVALTAAAADAPLMDGIRHTLHSTGPAYLLSLVFFTLAGLHFGQGTVDDVIYRQLLSGLEAQFTFHPVLLLPPVLLFGLILLRCPVIPAFAAGIVSGGILAGILQGETASSVAAYLYDGYFTGSSDTLLAQMLNRGGLTSMLPTIALLLSACVFSAPIQCSGVVNWLLGTVKEHVRTGGALCNCVLLIHSALFSVTGSYYVSVPVVASMTRELFPAVGLDPKNLMRLLQDTGAGLSALVPWAATGVYITAMLGLKSTTDYFLWAPMPWLSILISVAMNCTGWGLPKLAHEIENTF